MLAEPGKVTLRRLRSNRLAGPPAASVDEVVGWFGAVQAQDYPAASWAVAQRTPGSATEDVDRLLADGTVLRTHVLRPTWHLVLRSDIGWLLDLTGPRVRASTAWRRRQLGLDDATVARSNAVLADALDGTSLTRRELNAALARRGIAVDLMQTAHLLLDAELVGLICSGGLRGREHTYALLDQRAPRTRRLGADESLAEIALRYFRSHGPATLGDFCWWSGLSVRLGRRALAVASDGVEEVDVAGLKMYAAQAPARPRVAGPSVRLLPNFDEYFVAYAARGLHVDVARFGPVPTSQEILSNSLVIGGAYAGSWRRVATRAGVALVVHPRAPLDSAETGGLEQAAARYGEAVGSPVDLEVAGSTSGGAGVVTAGFSNRGGR